MIMLGLPEIARVRMHIPELEAAGEDLAEV
jgi:hypothetical protein